MNSLYVSTFSNHSFACRSLVFKVHKVLEETPITLLSLLKVSFHDNYYITHFFSAVMMVMFVSCALYRLCFFTSPQISNLNSYLLNNIYFLVACWKTWLMFYRIYVVFSIDKVFIRILPFFANNDTKLLFVFGSFSNLRICKDRTTNS